MSKKIYVSPSNQNNNTYASGGTNEKEQCKKIAASCVSLLEKNGFNVKCTYNDSMEQRVKESNAFGADVHVAIHTNATSAHKTTGGTQILLYDLNGERKKIGQAVFDRLAPLTPGKSAEKLIAKPDFYEVNSATGITVYCECEFHDTKEGAEYIIKNAAAIGEAIALGICDYYGVKPAVNAKKDTAAEKKSGADNKTAAASASQKTLYTVQCGAFSQKKNAEAYVKKLKAAGFDAFVVKK